MGVSGKPFVSHAQNFEDVVLWRVLQGVDRGCYVDVGAWDPVADSISWSFYEQGWRGALIEPVPAWADALRRRRPHDITIEAAAGATAGCAPLFASATTGNSSLVRDVANRIGAAGVEFSEIATRVAPLDDLLEAAGFRGRTIHFCTIDVEGSEADVLAGFDLARWHPWILVVEATEPNRRQSSHDAWEHRVLEQGYRFCLFDGLNRFYVHPDKADDLGDSLSYPACVFDDPFCRAVTNAHRTEELDRIVSEAERRIRELEQIAARVAQIESENATLSARASEAAARVSAMENTTCWRVTRRLRAFRAKQIRSASARRNTSAESPRRDNAP